MSTGGLFHYVKLTRDPLVSPSGALRAVYRSEVLRRSTTTPRDLHEYVADRAPLFYRRADLIAAQLQDGYFLTAIRETLAKLPTAQSFSESHCGEIIAGLFAEEVLGLRKLYNKLSMLSTQNSNAYKMDLVMYDPTTSPIDLVFCEVKCSPKCAIPGAHAGHDKSCYSDIFESLRKYTNADRDFDLTAAKDNLDVLSASEQALVKAALRPYSLSKVRYAAIAVIDNATYSNTECDVLHKRKSKRTFEVDIVCVESFETMAVDVHSILNKFRL